jgi:hypothetical protein
MSTTKIDVSTIYEMFETIKSKLDKQKSNADAPAQMDLSTINELTEQLNGTLSEIKKPTKVEHIHGVEVRNSWFFLSWVGLLIVILGLSWVLANQRQTISQYKNSDLKYRYVKMLGNTNIETFQQLERQFQYIDSIKLIKNQVEKFEKLVRLQAEQLERARQNEIESQRLQKEAERLKIND